MELFCKWCNETKDAEYFVRREPSKPYSQSNVRCCKECNTRRNRGRYKDPVVRTKQLVANDDWKQRNREKLKEYETRFNERNPANMKARNRIGYLKRSGFLVCQPCCICGSNEQVEAHHDSYAEAHWEQIRWLCKDHHETWHTILDPIKKQLRAKDIETVERMRLEAKETMRQINELRAKHKKLIGAASEIETAAWNSVIIEADRMFQDFLKA